MYRMEELANLGDPLAINLRKQTAALIPRLPEDSPYVPSLKNASSKAELLNTLSYLLSLPAYTIAVATAFRPILLDLCARWLHDEEHEPERFEALCLLLEIHLEVYPYADASSSRCGWCLPSSRADYWQRFSANLTEGRALFPASSK